MHPFLDFHTHAQGCKKYLTHSDVLVVQSLHLGEKPEPRADFATWGVHPMLEGAREFVDRLQHHPNELLADWTHTLTSTPAIIGIGECGWDHRSPLTLQEQETLIHFHITLAELLHYPLVFHVVGGWHHLLAHGRVPPHLQSPMDRPRLSRPLHPRTATHQCRHLPKPTSLLPQASSRQLLP